MLLVMTTGVEVGGTGLVVLEQPPTHEVIVTVEVELVVLVTTVPEEV